MMAWKTDKLRIIFLACHHQASCNQSYLSTKCLHIVLLLVYLLVLVSCSYQLLTIIPCRLTPCNYYIIIWGLCSWYWCEGNITMITVHQCGDCRHFTVTGPSYNSNSRCWSNNNNHHHRCYCCYHRPVGSQSFILTRISDGYHLSIITLNSQQILNILALGDFQCLFTSY